MKRLLILITFLLMSSPAIGQDKSMTFSYPFTQTAVGATQTTYEQKSYEPYYEALSGNNFFSVYWNLTGTSCGGELYYKLSPNGSVWTSYYIVAAISNTAGSGNVNGMGIHPIPALYMKFIFISNGFETSDCVLTIINRRQ